MKLHLINGYPYPYPKDLNEDQQHDLSEAAPGRRLVLDEVAKFEQLHTTTVEFASAEACRRAQALTGWPRWGEPQEHVLEAPVSIGDAYLVPAIIAGDTAYCGWQLADELADAHRAQAQPAASEDDAGARWKLPVRRTVIDGYRVEAALLQRMVRRDIDGRSYEATLLRLQTTGGLAAYADGWEERRHDVAPATIDRIAAWCDTIVAGHLVLAGAVRDMLAANDRRVDLPWDFLRDAFGAFLEQMEHDDEPRRYVLACRPDGVEVEEFELEGERVAYLAAADSDAIDYFTLDVDQGGGILEIGLAATGGD